MSTLTHPDNNHWQEWRDAVQRTSYTGTLKMASLRLQLIETLTPEQFEEFAATIYHVEECELAFPIIM
jgi:hypothetical protein